MRNLRKNILSKDGVIIFKNKNETNLLRQTKIKDGAKWFENNRIRYDA